MFCVYIWKFIYQNVPFVADLDSCVYVETSMAEKFIIK